MELTLNNSAILAKNAFEIRKLGKRVIEDIIKIGELLAESKATCGHGNWISWLNKEFGWTDQTARNFINVYEMSKSKKFLDLDLPVSVLYQLAAPSTSLIVREEIIEKAKSGEKVTVKDVKVAIAKTTTIKLVSPPIKTEKEDVKTEDVEPVVLDLKPAQILDYDWDTDPRTKQLKRKINELGDQLDEANEKLELFRKIKIWAEDNDQWMFIKDEALRKH